MMHILIVHAPADAPAASSLKNELADLGEIETLRLPQAEALELAGADLALLLLSPHFLHPDIENDATLDALLARSTDDHFLLLPILLSDCGWEDSIYTGLKLLPQDKVPLQGYGQESAREMARKRLGKEIRQLIEAEDFRRSEPEAYAKAQAQALKKGPGFYRLAGRVAWTMLPGPAKWGLRLGLGGAIGLIIWGLVG